MAPRKPPRESEAELVKKGSYFASYDEVERLVKLQRLDSIICVIDMNLAKDDLAKYPRENEHLYFKIVLLDCGLYDIVRNGNAEFWPRMSKVSMLILDSFNHETAPGEARAVREMLPDTEIRTFSFCAQPSANIVK